MTTEKIISALLLISLISSCKKEDNISAKSNAETIHYAENELSIVSSCDDTTAFKSQADLNPLFYIEDCFLCNATKEVPGLGAIPWTANIKCWVVNDNKLNISFTTFRPYFGYMLDRENIGCGWIPFATGVYPVFDNYQFQQNTENLTAGYGRLNGDGDIIDGYWEIDTICTNFIEVTHIDIEDRLLSGKFEFHFKMKEQGQFGVLYSERIRFINGKFEARILDL